MKIEFDASLITRTRANPLASLKLLVLCLGDSALCSQSLYTHCILHVYWKSIKSLWVEPFEMNVKIDQGSIFVVANDSNFFNAKEVSQHSVVR